MLLSGARRGGRGDGARRRDGYSTTVASPGGTPAVSAATLGAWVLKCNPRLTDPDELAERGVHAWCVAPNYRTRLMASGQPVLLWVTGARPQRYQRGFWAGGVVIGAASDSATDGPRVPLQLDFWPRPVGVDDLAAVPTLTALEVLRQPQMANPSFVTAAQWQDLRPLLP